MKNIDFQVSDVDTTSPTQLRIALLLDDKYCRHSVVIYINKRLSSKSIKRRERNKHIRIRGLVP